RPLVNRAPAVYRAPTHEFRTARIADAASGLSAAQGMEQIHGSAKKKDLAVEARHAPFGRCAEGAYLCRGQELRRAAPPAPHRPEDGHVSRSPGDRGQGRLIPGEGRLRPAA